MMMFLWLSCFVKKKEKVKKWKFCMWFSVYIRSVLWTCCSLVLTFCNMAQLPPKVPTITPNWPDFSYQKMEALSINHHHHTPTTPTAAAPSWVDEFLDFSSARRGSHRRSMSDSVAFLEPPMVDECRSMRHSSTTSLAAAAAGPGDFDRFDDDQLMSMFNDDGGGVGPTVSCSNPSSPSDHNSINDDEKQGPSDHPNPMMLLPQGQQQPKSEPEEDDSSCKSDGINGSGEKIADPKRIKRILANRQSAQRSRVRKLQYISELERSVSSLQAEVSVLSPRVAFLDHQRLVLNVDNSVLKQRIAALAQDKVFKDAHQEALKREIERLRQIYYHQNLKNGDKVADTNCSAEKEQLAVN